MLVDEVMEGKEVEIGSIFTFITGINFDYHHASQI